MASDTLMILVLTLLCVMITAQPMGSMEGDEDRIEGTKGLKVLFKKRGGAIVLHRDIGRRRRNDSDGSWNETRDGPPQGSGDPGQRPPPAGGPGQDRPGGGPGQGGGPRGEDNKPRKSGEIRIEWGRMEERKRSGGRPPFDEAKKARFLCERNNDTSLPNSNDQVMADCLRCRGMLNIKNKQIQMNITVCVVKSNGTITQDGETTEVYDGQMKFSVELGGEWPWEADSEYLDVDIVIKVPSGRRIMKKNPPGGGGGGGQGRPRPPKEFSFGADSFAYFSNKVRIDGVLVDMPDEEYPKKQNRGSNTVITLRIPRFNETAYYDPAVEVGYQEEEEQDLMTTASPDTSRCDMIKFSWLSLTAALIILAILRQFQNNGA